MKTTRIQVEKTTNHNGECVRVSVPLSRASLSGFDLDEADACELMIELVRVLGYGKIPAGLLPPQRGS